MEIGQSTLRRRRSVSGYYPGHYKSGDDRKDYEVQDIRAGCSPDPVHSIMVE
jgi:hypothetical protein